MISQGRYTVKETGLSVKQLPQRSPGSLPGLPTKYYTVKKDYTQMFNRTKTIDAIIAPLNKILADLDKSFHDSLNKIEENRIEVEGLQAEIGVLQADLDKSFNDSLNKIEENQIEVEGLQAEIGVLQADAVRASAIRSRIHSLVG